MADLGAAFGFYPQLNRRRQGSPADSANLPVDVLRGRLAGLLGLPADIANLLRSPSPTEMFGDTSYEAPAQFPYTTEKFLKDLPLAPTSRVGQVAGQAASFVPLNPMPAVRGVQKIGQMAGEELAATMMGQRPNSMMSKVVPQPLFVVAPEQGLLSVKTEPIESLLQTKPQAPVSDIGFYSATEQAALNLGRNKGTGQSFINDLMKSPDVKKEELQFTGLDEFLRDKPNVTKQEVQDFLANNRVDVKEVTYGAAIAEDPIGIAKRKEVFDKYEPEIQALYKEMDDPKYKLVNRGMGAEEYNRGVVLQNRGFRGEQLTTQEQFELEDILRRLDGNTVQEFANVEEARKVYLGMSQEEKLMHSIRPVKSSTELQQEINKIQNVRDVEADALYVVPESTPTKFGKYQLAGGENYREILLTLPPKTPKTLPEGYSLQSMANGNFTLVSPDNIGTIIYASSKDDAMAEAIRRFTRKEESYQSSHFNEPNILAHMRVNDRVDADGKRMLLVEEIQSDWHQAGREKGYQNKSGVYGEKVTPEEYKRGVELQNQQRNQSEPLTASEQAELSNIMTRHEASIVGARVPDAPFKDTWYQLALKRLTKYAAENGYERIGLTTGKQQAERFDLSKQLSRVGYRDGRLQGYDNDGALVMSKSVDPKELPDYVGKELGQKIAVNAEKDAEIRKALRQAIKDDLPEDQIDALRNQLNAIPEEYSGLDLQVGGEGMKKYYDEIYPKFLDKYGKKYGASVGETQITTGYARDASGIPAQRPSKETIRYLDITPQMKEGTSKGQPLFAATPLLPATSLLDEEKRKEITSLLE